MKKVICCAPSKSKRACADLVLSAESEICPPNRIAYIFKTVNKGSLLARSALLTVIFDGIPDPPTQSGWKFEGKVAKFALGDISLTSSVVAVITFSANQESTAVGMVSSDTIDCGSGESSAVISNS